jgi:N-carbamoylputrescine amidase
VSTPVSIALCQLTAEPYAADRDREASVAAAREAFERGADVVVLPEMIVPGYVADRERLRPLAEPVDGPTVAAWTALAAEHDGYLAGGFCEREADRLYNSAVLVGPDGLLLHYRKLHLFAAEKVAFAPGDRGLPVATTRFGTAGLCICYDLRFVETARILALRGADLILVPTAWVPGFDEESWDAAGMAPQAHGALLQGNLNQVFVACASQAGERGGVRFLGSSLLADPRGHAQIGPLPRDRDVSAIATVDVDEAEAARRRSPLIEPRADRRTDVYRLVVDGREAL